MRRQFLFDQPIFRAVHCILHSFPYQAHQLDQIKPKLDPSNTNRTYCMQCSLSSSRVGGQLLDYVTGIVIFFDYCAL